MTFKIDRFLDVEDNALAGINETPDAIFGFGRRWGLYLDVAFITYRFAHRACPGRFIGLDFVWIVVASLLATYNISKPVDAKGQVVEPEVEYTSILIRYADLWLESILLGRLTDGNTLSHPKPFKCRIIPRSENAKLLIEQTKDMTMWNRRNRPWHPSS